MIGYISNRIVYLIPVLFFMSVVVFLFTHLIPGDPVDYILGLETTPEARAALRAELGLDRNIVIQYLSWAGKIVTGDFGKSVVSGRRRSPCPAATITALTRSPPRTCPSSAGPRPHGRALLRPP